MVFLRRFCKICLEVDLLVFTSLDFATIIFFLQSKVVSLVSNPQLGKPGLCIYAPSRDRVAQVYLQAPGSLFVAFCDPQGYDGGILTRLHTGELCDNVIRFSHTIKLSYILIIPVSYLWKQVGGASGIVPYTRILRGGELKSMQGEATMPYINTKLSRTQFVAPSVSTRNSRRIRKINTFKREFVSKFSGTPQAPPPPGKDSGVAQCIIVTIENALVVTICAYCGSMCLKVILKSMANNYRIQPLEALYTGIVSNQRIEGNQVS
jgi:hypothetical protein